MRTNGYVEDSLKNVVMKRLGDPISFVGTLVCDPFINAPECLSACSQVAASPRCRDPLPQCLRGEGDRDEEDE